MEWYTVKLNDLKRSVKLLKTLTDLGLRKEIPLTPEQESLFNQAVDPHEQYLSQLEP